VRVLQGRPFEDSTAYDETCGVPDDIASMSRRYGAGGKNNLLLGKAEHLFRSPSPSFFAQCTPKYNSQAPHAIVACITPGSCQMYSITFVSPFASSVLVVVIIVFHSRCRWLCTTNRKHDECKAISHRHILMNLHRRFLVVPQILREYPE
jgi:hypothetical protein